MSLSLDVATDEALGDCSREALSKLKKSQLQDQLSKRGFRDRQLKGKKDDLVDRLYNVLHSAANAHALQTKSARNTSAVIKAAAEKAKQAADALKAAGSASGGSPASGSHRGKKRKRNHSSLDQLFGPTLAELVASRIADARKILSAPSTASSSANAAASASDPLSTVEVEARLGTKRPFTEAEKQDRKRSGASQKNELFEAGTSPTYWKSVTQALQNYSGWKDSRGRACSAPTEVTTYDVMFDAGGVSQRRERVRVELNAQGRASLENSGAVIIKRKLGDAMDTRMEGHYDLRIGLADEHPVSAHAARAFAESAEDLFSPVTDLHSRWELMRTGVALRTASHVMLDPRPGVQGVPNTDRILSLLREAQSKGNSGTVTQNRVYKLPGWLAQRMKWTLLNVGARRSLEGHSVGGGSSRSKGSADKAPASSAELVDITCLPGKVFMLPGPLPPRGDPRWQDPANWHYFPICAYKGRVPMRDLQVLGCSVRGVPRGNGSAAPNSQRSGNLTKKRANKNSHFAVERQTASSTDAPGGGTKTPIEYRKKRRTSYEMGNGMRLDMTRTQMSKRSIQDLDVAKVPYEIEFEIDFAKMSAVGRSARDFRRLARQFLDGIAHLMYSHSEQQ